ncbi:hypothetical protein ACFWZY_16910 [Streptomyces sp. NPDC058992]|uniref:hypothetical protein n=1 Tax=Streptomyces sp. NPDC058992 TaxID=3346688 RepID=UPI00369355D3
MARNILRAVHHVATSPSLLQLLLVVAAVTLLARQAAAALFVACVAAVVWAEGARAQRSSRPGPSGCPLCARALRQKGDV